jgi:hypothetical protein
MRTLVAFSAALFLAACSGGDDDGDPIVPEDGGAPHPDVVENTCDGVEFELGSGLRTYIPVSDGDTVYLYRGPQAGYHIYLSTRTKGIDPADATVCWKFVFTSGAENGKTFADKCWRTRLTNDLGDGRFERVGIPGEVLSEYWNGQSFKIRGKDARVDVTIADTKGCSAAAGWDVHIFEELGM